MTLTALIATKHEIISGIPKMDLLINSSKYAARISIVGLLQTHEMSILSDDRPLKIISEKAVSGGMPLAGNIYRLLSYDILKHLCLLD